METTMFIAFLTASFYSYYYRNFIGLDIFLGLTIWCMSDGFVIWAAILLDFLIQSKYLSSTDIKTNNYETWTTKKIFLSFGIACILVLIYIGFNYILSGELLPNTYKAKLKYYQNNDQPYFLQNDVINYFSSKEFVIIWIPFIIELTVSLFDFIKKRKNEFVVYFIFILDLVLMYYLMLPFSHRFGRYLMPVIPFYILISFYGIRIILEFLIKKKINVGFINFLFAAFVIAGIILSLKAIGDFKI